jgi:hypothetical protein
MRWPTYDREHEEIADAEEIVDSDLAPFSRKLDPCLGR